MFTKFAKAEIIETRSSATRLDAPALSRFSSYNDYRTSDGYIYTRVRAISSRVNKNFDGWPALELADAYRTFIGKPIFIDHHNSNPDKARGVVVDAVLHVEDDMSKASAMDPYYATAPSNHKPPTWIELLLETDAKSYPKLAADIIAGNIDSVSMGANVSHTKCSICGNDAYDTDDFCNHIKLKGASFDAWDDKGKRTSRVAYEDCYKVSFFEISYVFDPADETALVHEVKTSKTSAEDPYDPYGDETDESDEAWWEEYMKMLEGLSPEELEAHMGRLIDIGDATNEQLYDMVEKGDKDAAQELEYRHNRDKAKGEQDSKGPHGDGSEYDPYVTMPRDMLEAAAADGDQRAQEQLDWDPWGSFSNDELRQIAAQGNPGAQEALAKREQNPKADGFSQGLEGDIIDNIFNAGPAPHEPSGDERIREQTERERQEAWKKYLLENAAQSEFMDANGQPVQPQSDLDQFNHPDDPRLDPDDPRLGKLLTAARKFLAENPLPQSMETMVPEQVDTLRNEKICPICGQEYSDGHCDTCGYEEPPASFDNPDLGLAEKVRDLLEQSQENLAEPGAEMPQPPGAGMMPPMPPPGVGGPPGPGGGPPGPPGGPQMMANITNKPSATPSVNSDWTIVIRSRTASKVNKNEIPILPPTRYTSDLPTGQSVVKSSPKPVESKIKDTNKMKKHWDAITNELDKRKIDPVKVAALVEAGVIEHLVDRLAADAVTDGADYANSNLDQVGGEYGNPESGTTHENVEKDTNPGVAPNTMTYGDNGTDAVTSEDGSAGFGTIGVPVAASAKPKMAGGFPDHEPSHINLDGPLKEEVAPNTMTFGTDDFHVGEPVTQGENGNQVGGPIGVALASAKAHIFTALKLAETEVSLGLIPAEEKFDRAAILEQHTPEDLVARTETLSSVKKAGLAKDSSSRKTVSKIPAGLAKAAAVSVESNSSSDDGDSALFM